MMRYPFGYGYGMMNGGWLGGLLMLVLGALVVAAIVVLIVWAVRAGRHGSSMTPPPAAPHDEAVAIAKRRYASGEITKEQFDEVMRALGS